MQTARTLQAKLLLDAAQSLHSTVVTTTIKVTAARNPSRLRLAHYKHVRRGVLTPRLTNSGSATGNGLASFDVLHMLMNIVMAPYLAYQQRVDHAALCMLHVLPFQTQQIVALIFVLQCRTYKPQKRSETHMETVEF